METQFAEPVLTGKADLVIPRRRSMDSYPLEQQYAELLGNQLLSYMLGRYFDFWFGPAAIGATALPFFLGYDGKAEGRDDTWDSIHIPRVRILAAGLHVESVDIGYRHPNIQTAEEQGDLTMGWKRVGQLINLVLPLWEEAYRLGLTTQPPPQTR